MGPGNGSPTQVTGIGREWLESLLNLLPQATVLIEPGTGVVTFANRAADELAGGEFPRGRPERRNGSTNFHATHTDGRRLTTDELPSIRAARGERIENFEVNWTTPRGTRNLLVRGSFIEGMDDQPDSAVVCFDDITELKEAERERNTSLAMVDALFAGAPVGLGSWDCQLRYVRVNEKLAEINGLPVEEHIGRTIPEVIPSIGDRVSEEFTKVLETGEPILNMEFTGETPAAAGEMREFSTGIYPVRDEGGQVTGVGAVVIEITERRRAERERAQALEQEREAAARARFLAEASVILDESLDYEATLRTVSRLVVPWLADWCGVDMAEPDGRLRRVTVAHVDPDKVQLAEEWERRYPTDPKATSGTYNVMRTGKSEIYPDITDEMLVAAARDEEHLELIRSIGMRSGMAVPMVARGRTLGVISFVAAETGRRYGEADLMLAEELARRAATSIDNARLYSERSFIAHTLQRSLLPPHLPDIAGLELAGRYRPVGEGNEVGGDFYDLFDIGTDSWAVVIGDVCGKGAEAAALTALSRYTIRAIASADKLPSETLLQLNDAILRQRSDNRFCTVAFGRMTKTRDGVHVELASGGHPLPIVIRKGSGAEYVGEPGTLLGIVADPTLHDVAVDLHPGDSLVLYTDGVTEAGAPDRLLEPEDLVAEIGRCAESGAAEVAACLERAAVAAGEGEPHDDIAIVVLHVLEDEEAGQESGSEPGAAA